MQQLQKIADLLAVANLSKIAWECLLTKCAQKKKNSLQNTSRSCPKIKRTIDDLSKDIENELEIKISQYEFYSMALDESTDITDTAQLSIFVRGVINNFEVIEELLEMFSMEGTTTG